MSERVCDISRITGGVNILEVHGCYLFPISLSKSHSSFYNSFGTSCHPFLFSLLYCDVKFFSEFTFLIYEAEAKLLAVFLLSCATPSR